MRCAPVSLLCTFKGTNSIFISENTRIEQQLQKWNGLDVIILSKNVFFTDEIPEACIVVNPEL